MPSLPSNPLRWMVLTTALAAAATQSASAQTADAPSPGASGAASTNVPARLRFFGPLTTEEAGPLQRLAFTHTVEGADLIPAGTFQADLWMGYANIFEQDSADTHDLFLDLEWLSTTAGVRYGVTDRLEVGGRLSFETTGGGILDPFISGWHSKLGLGNGNREKYPHSVYEQRLQDGRGNTYMEIPRSTLALEDVRVFAKWRAWASRGGDKLLSLRGVARVPVQGDPDQGRRSDVAVMALFRAAGAPWYFHGTVGGATTRAAQDFDGLLRRGAFFVDLAVERNLAPWVSGVAQVSVASPRLQGFADPELDGWPINLVFGVTGQVADGWRVDVSFQEDIPPNTPAVDFTLGIGVRRSW